MSTGVQRAASEDKKGSSEALPLSRIEESEAEESQAQEQLASKPVPSLATAPKGTETVLVVEDQDGIRDIVREALRRNGYNVLIAVDGNEALQMASTYADPIHLLITDLVMPNIGGRELAQRLTPLRPRMKVLFMSGYSEHSALNIEATSQPATVLQKPFSLDALARNVRRVLDEPECSS